MLIIAPTAIEQWQRWPWWLNSGICSNLQIILSHPSRQRQFLASGSASFLLCIPSPFIVERIMGHIIPLSTLIGRSLETWWTGWYFKFQWTLAVGWGISNWKVCTTRCWSDPSAISSHCQLPNLPHFGTLHIVPRCVVTAALQTSNIDGVIAKCELGMCRHGQVEPMLGEFSSCSMSASRATALNTECTE